MDRISKVNEVITEKPPEAPLTSLSQSIRILGLPPRLRA
jgi:hypothetical protein